MIQVCKSAIAATVLLATSFMPFDEARTVRLHIQDSKGVSLSGVVLSIQGRVVNATINGYTTVALPSHFQPGDSVPVVLVKPKGFEIFPAFSQKFWVPSDKPGSEALIILVKSKEDQPSTEIIARRAAEIIISENKKAPPETKPENREKVAELLNEDPYALNTAIRDLAATQTDPTVKEIVGRYTQDYPYDFAISSEFFKILNASGTLQPAFVVTMGPASPIHSLSKDCEMHLDGTLKGINLGNPAGMVVEPPNVCKFGPGGEGSNPRAWEPLIQAQVVGHTCNVTGFPRIFTERGRPVAGAHFFELHPTMSIQCDGSRFSFEKFLTVFKGMRSTKPGSVASCLASRKLEFRYNKENDWYEFRENGRTCGNFAIVEILTIYEKPVLFRGTGHRARVSVTVDGKAKTDITVYTLAPSEADDWIAQVGSDSKPQWRYLHGMWTYDFQTILEAIKSQPTQWTNLEHPFAFVVFGQALKSPWK